MVIRNFKRRSKEEILGCVYNRIQNLESNFPPRTEEQNMREGYLSQYFQGVAVKRLKPVEADRSASHQHEFNGTVQMKQLLGSDRRTFPARFFWFGDEEEDTEHIAAEVTWYDARENHPTRS